MKLVNLSIVAAATCLLATSAHALKTEDRVLKGNYQVEYTKTPGAVNSIGEMFTEGEVYGRIRSNSFFGIGILKKMVLLLTIKCGV